MKHFLFIPACLFVLVGFAQIPPGYYDDAQGLSGQPLRSALHDIIDDHNAQSYSSMWGHFESTDNKGSNTVWDIYSDIPGGTPAYQFQFVADQCGSYGGEGDCFNREHTFPQSWYGSGTPMKSDFFHVYPTDGYVNGQRSNDPYGEVDIPFWTSTNGSMSGPNVSPGYSGNVFEPIDEYKGDLARNYFYMLTRYMDISGSWRSPMLSNGDLSGWATNLLLVWHQNDPVSTKELNRNNAVHDIQDNRNPFIDHPEWVDEIWSNTTGISGNRKEQALWFADGAMHFSASSAQGSLKVYNMKGQEQLNFSEIERNMLVLSLEPGFYLAQLVNTRQSTYLKFVVTD